MFEGRLTGPVGESSDFQNVVPGPSASASPKNVLEVQMLRSQPRVTSNFTPKYIFKRIKNLRTHKSAYIVVYSGIFHNGQKVETTELSNN